MDASGILEVKRLFDRRQRVVVLNYHRIGDPNATMFDRDIMSATPEAFERHLDFLMANFNVVSLSEAVELLHSTASLGHTAVTITFDDGYADNAAIAAPLLADRKLPATFFLATDFLDNRQLAWWDEIAWIIRHANVDVIDLPEYDLYLPLVGDERPHSIRRAIEGYKQQSAENAARLTDALAVAGECGRCPAVEQDAIWMTWDQARDLVKQGMTLGGHTMSHPVLARMSLDDQRAEIFGCRDRITDETGQQPRFFSYPVGQQDSFSEDTKQIVADAGFEHSFSFYGGVWWPGHDDQFDIPRMAVERMHVGSLFRARATWPTTLFANC